MRAKIYSNSKKKHLCLFAPKTRKLGTVSKPAMDYFIMSALTSKHKH